MSWRQIFEALKSRLFEQPVDAVIDNTPVDLRIVGRTLLHASLVGLAAGLVGVSFVRAMDGLEFLFLESAVGYVPLRASGEESHMTSTAFRWWLVIPLLVAGALLAGQLMRWAPEVKGGGADAAIAAYHTPQQVIRNRVLPAKFIASLATLSSGGSGGREGPTIQMGGAVGSLVSKLLQVSTRERSILLLAGAAAGISAVFRTPLGAALLVVEMVYSDGFENDALVPAVLASVISYAVAVTVHPGGVLLSHAATYPFVPAHLPLYAALAIFTSLGAVIFLTIYRLTRRFFASLHLHEALKPAVGAALLGILVLAGVFPLSDYFDVSPRGFGILGGGYGLVQVAISGASWLTGGWTAVAFFSGMMIVKALATSLTVGSGGSAGDFAPSMAMGGLIGGAFGRAAALLIDDPRIDPGAFVLVGMGAFYGGIAHVPLAALVMVCELAGTYDLLVPAMFAQGIAFVALRNHSLYHGQKRMPRVSQPTSPPEKQ